MSGLATASEERPVFIPAAGEDLFGIVTEPAGEPKGVGLVLLTGGAFIPATHRNRLWVRVARRAAALGYHALRLDYHGVGESSGSNPGFRLDRPFPDDLLAGVRYLEEQGAREIAVAGTCFGARTALASADRIPELRGLALLAPPVRDYEQRMLKIEAKPTSRYLRRAFSMEVLRGLRHGPTRRRYQRIARMKMRAVLRSGPFAGASRGAANGVSSLFSDPLAKLAARGTPVLIAYGMEDKPYSEFREARPQLAGVLDAPGARIEERVVDGVISGLNRLAAQDAVAGMIEEWLVRLDAVAGREA